ncbi:unnamed protein product [Vitrella brassicaformis CCMP3155]|uniref:Glutathione transferase n=1 Tax=Vitrella brassicaformis (strain CCMP3155) TaxID=1169540 RepID=A0A0G4EV75_VITBC|nr:unnamed protein product [Vitrella brassicaformis CCMP3155]|eukprot:CEM02165.1 unnamed protein product [Vitrella brassicaformis CCMP3155]
MTSEGAKTIEQRSATSDAHADVTFFSSWFCPYAQRAWIALEEKGVAYKYVEINPYEIGADGDTKRALSLEQKRERYPEFVRCSPRGLVPALNHGKPVWESLVAAEYIDEAFDGPPLMPSHPHERALVRIWMAHCNDRVIPHYYKALMAETEEGRQAARDNFINGLYELGSFMHSLSPSGGCFLGGDRFSLMDIALAPWWQRAAVVLRHYRGFKFPEDGPVWQRLHSWFDAVAGRPSYQRTVVSPEELIRNYAGYADNSATSDAAKKFRDS